MPTNFTLFASRNALSSFLRTLLDSLLKDTNQPVLPCDVLKTAEGHPNVPSITRLSRTYLFVQLTFALLQEERNSSTSGQSFARVIYRVCPCSMRGTYHNISIYFGCIDSRTGACQKTANNNYPTHMRFFEMKTNAYLHLGNPDYKRTYTK